MENPFEHVRAAGRRFVGKDESAASAMQDHATIPLAPKVAQYTLRGEIGKTMIHPGWRGDAHPDFPTRIFGKMGHSGQEDCKALMAAGDLPPMAAMVHAKAEERAFLSTKRLPLGKPYVPGGTIAAPLAVTLKPGFAYGKPGARTDESAKLSLAYEPEDPEAIAAAEVIYQKSHRSFLPGVQRRGAVDWALTGVDPSEKMFGKPSLALEKVGAGKAVIEGTAPALTKIIPKVVDDFRVSGEGGRAGGAQECAKGTAQSAERWAENAKRAKGRFAPRIARFAHRIA